MQISDNVSAAAGHKTTTTTTKATKATTTTSVTTSRGFSKVDQQQPSSTKNSNESNCCQTAQQNYAAQPRPPLLLLMFVAAPVTFTTPRSRQATAGCGCQRDIQHYTLHCLKWRPGRRLHRASISTFHIPLISITPLCPTQPSFDISPNPQSILYLFKSLKPPACTNY